MLAFLRIYSSPPSFFSPFLSNPCNTRPLCNNYAVEISSPSEEKEERRSVNEHGSVSISRVYFFAQDDDDDHDDDEDDDAARIEKARKRNLYL